MPAMYDKCDVCGCGCEHGDRYCDRCWEEVSCEDTPSDYEPTEQDLLDAEVTFAVDFQEPSDLSTFRSFAAHCDFDLDDLW